MTELAQQIRDILEHPMEERFVAAFVERHDGVRNGSWQQKRDHNNRDYLQRKFAHIRKTELSPKQEEQLHAVEQGITDFTKNVRYVLPERMHKAGYTLGDALRYLTYMRHLDAAEHTMRTAIEETLSSIVPHAYPASVHPSEQAVQRLAALLPSHAALMKVVSETEKNATSAASEKVVGQWLEKLEKALFAVAHEERGGFADMEEQKSVIRQSGQILEAAKQSLNQSMHTYFEGYMRNWQHTFNQFSADEKKKFSASLPPSLKSFFDERKQVFNKLPDADEAYFAPLPLKKRLDMVKQFIEWVGDNKRFSSQEIQKARGASYNIGMFMTVLEEIQSRLLPVVQQLNHGNKEK